MSDWFRKQPQITAGAQRVGQLPARPSGPPPVWAKATTPTALPPEKTGISSKVVMHHFARGQVRELEKKADALHALVVAKLRTLAEFKDASDAVLLGVVQELTNKLQSADLTINFSVVSFFSQPNNSRTYTQMYERGARLVRQADGSDQLQIAGNAKNNAAKRDSADTRVTFGSDITDPKMQGVARFMTTGGMQQVGTTNMYVVPNKLFNPKARQNFAALNYGRIPKGSDTGYGASHMILRNGLKTNAIYYIGDSFGSQVTANTRATFGTIVSLILHANDKVLKKLLDSCYRGMVQPAGDCSGDALLEAHIFDELRFKGDVLAMKIDRMEVLLARMAHMSHNLPGAPPDPDAIESNAKIFCHLNGIKLTFV